MPCPHHDIKIVQRSNSQSAVAAAALCRKTFFEDGRAEKAIKTCENRVTKKKPRPLWKAHFQ